MYLGHPTRGERHAFRPQEMDTTQTRNSMTLQTKAKANRAYRWPFLVPRSQPGMQAAATRFGRVWMSSLYLNRLIAGIVRRTPCRSAAGGRLRPTVSCNGLLGGIACRKSQNYGFHGAFTQSSKVSPAAIGFSTTWPGRMNLSIGTILRTTSFT